MRKICLWKKGLAAGLLALAAFFAAFFGFATLDRQSATAADFSLSQVGYQ